MPYTEMIRRMLYVAARQYEARLLLPSAYAQLEAR